MRNNYLILERAKHGHDVAVRMLLEFRLQSTNIQRFNFIVEAIRRAIF